MATEITRTLANGIKIVTSVENTIQAFKRLGALEEALGEQKCGKCGSENITPSHRVAKGYDFFGWKCNACGAQLDFGQTKEDHRLFAKRTLPDGGYDTTCQGWYHYRERREDTATPGAGDTSPKPVAEESPF